jgi:hypothetical protein
MTNNARIVEGIAVDVSADPESCFHPIIAAEFVAVPDEVMHGWTLTEGEWSAPVLAEPVAPVATGNLAPTPPEFLLLLTLQERVAIRAARATDLVVDDLLQMVEDPRLTFVELTNPSVIEAINYLSTIQPPLLTAERAGRVLSGLSAAAGQAQ